MALRLQANRLDGIVEEVERHVADGKLDSAALVVGVSTGKVDEFNSSYQTLQNQLRDAGASPTALSAAMPSRRLAGVSVAARGHRRRSVPLRRDPRPASLIQRARPRGRTHQECGLTPQRCEFALEEIPLIDLIESLLLQAHDLGQAGNTFEYEAWRADGAPEAALRQEFAASHDAARERRPQDTPRLDSLVALYAWTAPHIRGGGSRRRAPAGVRAPPGRRSVFLLALRRTPRYYAA